jgi:hypothetical protein
MKDVLTEAGIEVTSENKKKVDRIIHELVEVDYKNCSPTWKGVKEHIKHNDKARNQFIARLKSRLNTE